MKKITFILAFLAFSLFQGCKTFINEFLVGHKLEIRTTGERVVSDYKIYNLDSGSHYVNVEFFVTTNADKTGYYPLVIIYEWYGKRWSVLDSFGGSKEINGRHNLTYTLSPTIYSPDVKIYAELHSKIPIQDSAILLLTEIYVW